MENLKEILVTEKFKDTRLDVFLVKKHLVSSRSSSLKLISRPAVFLKGKALKSSYRLKTGDLLKIILPPIQDVLDSKLIPYDHPLEIIFEDEEILVVNKPAGLVVHPAPGHKDKTLVNILFSKKKLSSGSHKLRPGIVHRLDKEVSGLMILSKTKNSEKNLIQQFKKHEIERKYWAITLYAPSVYQGKIETWIKRDSIHRKKFVSLKRFQSGSKKAISYYKVLKQHRSGISWLECQLKTGRTHQVRVHLSSIGCPILGDFTYGRQKLSFIKDKLLKKELQNLKRIALHAQSLKFKHPQSKKILSFKSPWPKELRFLLENLKIR
ncbi:MAG: RluA family pseudouridine synthase [Bdellovibrionaceae bacterium]|nr:RluA family pseudouridine synthase [Pseudobdellovibrionaceae bacterium]